jgi:hypothetical protein
MHAVQGTQLGKEIVYAVQGTNYDMTLIIDSPGVQMAMATEEHR